MLGSSIYAATHPHDTQQLVSIEQGTVLSNGRVLVQVAVYVVFANCTSAAGGRSTCLN